MIRINANLFRIAYSCVSKEETRYYLNGVFVEPHPQGGVTMTATDGHKLIHIHDESGFADESAIIRLDTKLCKAKRGMARVVTVETGSNEATVSEAFENHVDDRKAHRKVALAVDARIDGSFPDYRRVIPAKFNNSVTPAFASYYLSQMGTVGVELAAHFCGFNAKGYHGIDRSDAVHICASDDERPTACPALVTWPAVPKAFAVLMPVTAETDGSSLPDWYSPAAPSLAPAEQDQETKELENA